MKIQILGAHNRESRDASCVCFLIDNTLAIDAGGLTSNLSIAEQDKLAAIFITHGHYDHIRDIPGIGLNLSFIGKSIEVYSAARVNTTIKNHLLNGVLYPNFQDLPPEKPTISFIDIAPYKTQRINGYEITALPVNHNDITYGFHIGNHSGETMFYTSDTGPGLSECWKHISPRLLFIDVTMPNTYDDFARQTGHLTPAMLKEELIAFRNYKGYLPLVIAVHMDTGFEPQIRKEIKTVAQSLDIPITVAEEGMQFNI